MINILILPLRGILKWRNEKGIRLILILTILVQPQLVLSQKKPQEKQIEKIDSLLKVGWKHKYSDMDSMLHYTTIAKHLAQSIAYKKGIGAYYLALGLYNQEKGYAQKALESYLKAIDIVQSEETPNKTDLATSLMYTGEAYARLLDFEKALDFGIQSTQHFEKSGNQRGMAQAYLTLGQTYQQMNMRTKALEYSKKALRIYQDLELPRLAAITSNSIGISYKNLKMYDSAIFAYKRTLNLVKGDNYDRILAYTLNNIGTVFFEKQELDSALVYYQRSTLIKARSNDIYGQISALTNIGNVYGLKGKYELSIKYLEESISLSREHSQKDALANSISSIHQIAFNHKEYRKAYLYLSELKQLHDSTNTIQKQKAIAEIETKYETEKKDNEILQLENTRQAQEIIISQNRVTQYSLAGVLVSLLLAGGFFWKDRQRKILLEKYKAEEAEKNRIARELHDGIANELLSIGESLGGESSEQKVRLLEADQELRKFAHQLETKRKFESSIADILNDYISQARFDGNLEIKIDFFPRTFDLENQELKLNIFRIWQELLSNTIKHSGANKCFLQLAFSGKKIELTYKDNGSGITHNNKGEGIGLQNIRERVELLKGKLNMTSSDSGFVIRMEVPIRKSQIIIP